MPNTLSLSGPPWFPSMTFPSTWYHPVYAARVIATAADLAQLDWTWSPTAGIADMRRTETEAQLAIDHANQIARDAIVGVAPPAGVGNVNQNSASWQQALDGAAAPASGAGAQQAGAGRPRPGGPGVYPLTMPPPGTELPGRAAAEPKQNGERPQERGERPTQGGKGPQERGDTSAKHRNETPTSGSHDAGASGQHQASARPKEPPAK